MKQKIIHVLKALGFLASVIFAVFAFVALFVLWFMWALNREPDSLLRFFLLSPMPLVVCALLCLAFVAAWEATEK